MTFSWCPFSSEMIKKQVHFVSNKLKQTTSIDRFCGELSVQKCNWSKMNVGNVANEIQ